MSKGIKFAETEKVDELEYEINEILDAAGIARAFISDRSTFSDFQFSEKELDSISEKIEIAVCKHDLVWQVAKKMKEKKKANPFGSVSF